MLFGAAGRIRTADLILTQDEVAVTLKGGIEICQKIMY